MIDTNYQYYKVLIISNKILHTSNMSNISLKPVARYYSKWDIISTKPTIIISMDMHYLQIKL